MSRRLTALLVSLLVLVPGTAAAAPAIVGGTAADQPYPFAVSLHSSSGKLFCAGALIAPTWVVTAAHCAFDKAPSAVTARAGTNEAGEGGEAAQLAEIIVNPAFNTQSPAGDIALLRLAAPVQAAPIGLAAAASPGTATRILGWGQTCPKLNCGGIPTTLQQLDTHIVEGAKCTSVFDGTAELCTDNPGGKAGACFGDSGGPEIVRDGDHWLLVGVTSRPGNNDPECATAPSIYTSVVAYAPWIAEKTKA
ncbi:S1 family peptidase [Amycolatopsis australiensis]|uniref:Trypsin n=1 Tax=Amycolatopsis australiensis TaxID=546364 RepID=A0A1K1R065_9PSEU|nr:serine protease [Amycolatopsis australiensis]SFW65528.1 Trypsin [Amycolatopsis australiensis]